MWAFIAFATAECVPINAAQLTGGRVAVQLSCRYIPVTLSKSDFFVDTVVAKAARSMSNTIVLQFGAHLQLQG